MPMQKKTTLIQHYNVLPSSIFPFTKMWLCHRIPTMHPLHRIHWQVYSPTLPIIIPSSNDTCNFFVGSSISFFLCCPHQSYSNNAHVVVYIDICLNIINWKITSLKPCVEKSNFFVLIWNYVVCTAPVICSHASRYYDKVNHMFVCLETLNTPLNINK